MRSIVSLETTFLVDLLRGVPAAVARGTALDEAGEPRCVTAPAASELLVGAHHLGGSELARATALLDSLTLLDFDLEACHEAGRIGASLIARGETIGTIDLLIAAITKRHGQRLLTRDIGFARVQGLGVEMY